MAKLRHMDGVMSFAIIDSNKNPNSDHTARVWRIPA